MDIPKDFHMALIKAQSSLQMMCASLIPQEVSLSLRDELLADPRPLYRGGEQVKLFFISLTIIYLSKFTTMAFDFTD